MKLVYDKAAEKPQRYTLWLSVNDTENWARKPGAAWPCSTAAGHRFVVQVDSNGLCDLAQDGKQETDVAANELAAIVADHLPKPLRHLWPVWSRD